MPDPRRTGSRQLCLPTLAATSIALALSVSAQPPSKLPTAPSAPQSSAPTLHVYTRETIVDVLVTDEKGQPVRGLTRSDFTVEEDGNPQPIRGFYEIDKETPPPAPPTLPPDTYTNARALPANGPVQIFLFDLLGSPPACMEQASKYIADYLRTMPVGTQVALFAFSPSKDLRLLQDFTSDGPAAAAVVDKLDVEWNRNPVKATPIAIAGMNQIADYIAGIHGRKNLVWIVPGMPLMITRDGGLSWAVGTPPDMTIVHRLMDLYDRFTQEQIAIYPLNPCGIHAPNLQVEAVAEATGGATNNTNDYKSEAAKFVDATSHFYTLSYVPPRPDEDGHFHPIKIAVDRPGLHLVYRSGYNDEQPNPPAPALIHDMIQGPMRLGAIPSTQILFDLHVQLAPASSPSKPAESPASNPAIPHTKGTPYNVLFQFDPTQIALTQLPDGSRTASIEIDLGAYDSFSQLVAARSQTFKIAITPAQYPGSSAASSSSLYLSISHTANSPCTLASSTQSPTKQAHSRFPSLFQRNRVPHDRRKRSERLSRARANLLLLYPRPGHRRHSGAARISVVAVGSFGYTFGNNRSKARQCPPCKSSRPFQRRSIRPHHERNQ